MRYSNCSIPEAIQHSKQGKLLIITDREDRENEGDFFLPAALITPEAVNFMITYGKGLLCVPITSARAKLLNLPLMVSPNKNTESTGVNFTISVNAAKGISSGVSAFDRALTIQRLASETAQSSDFTRPGHIFPLIAKDGGILQRDGHTEAAIEMARLAGFPPVGVLCEIIHSNGKMAKSLELQRLAKQFDLKILAITDVIAYIKTHKSKKTF
ncbi:MAG TPA: 3,4-dihydroxy-2-butanone-4-phosphate synthase [Candidatus Saccharimonadales bacterium]|nr:3,4-dihydroxy-2-butanone-4-phosphate synthase [Candidatus Saccharimonadales bacterium]